MFSDSYARRAKVMPLSGMLDFRNLVGTRDQEDVTPRLGPVTIEAQRHRGPGSSIKMKN